MDADLARVAAGLSVSPVTEEAATSVLKGAAAATAVTRMVPGGVGTPPGYTPPRSRYYEYEPPVRRRPIWPWLLAALLLAAAGVAAYYVYTKIDEQLTGATPISVPFVEGKQQRLAVKEITDAGLTPNVRRQPNENVDPGRVFDQDPAAGTRVDKETTVVIFVSSGKAKTTVPDVVDHTRDDAVAALTAAHLKVDVHEVYSEKEPGTVTAQDPPAGTRVEEGATVRINISRGVKQVPVPSVVGQTIDEANAALEAAGFVVGAPVFENSDKPENTVIAQDPGGGSLQRPGTTVTITASKGPAKTPVPDVEGLDTASARATLTAAGFKVVVVFADTDNPSEDGIVLVQSPGAGTDAAPGDTITLTAGRFVAPPTTDTTTTDTTTIPTEPIPPP